MAHFLIRKLPDELRGALEADAAAENIPIQEVVRSILCEHYALDCTPVTGWKRQDVWEGSRTILVRMQDELFTALKEDAAETGESMQALTHAALAAHYSDAAVT